MYSETWVRSVLKTFSWRICGTLATMGLVFVFTRKANVAVAVGGIEMAAKMLLYYGHERLWDRIRIGRRPLKPVVLWFTGLSGAGKSTLAEKVYAELQDRGMRVEFLDGDTIRSIFPNTGFSREEREEHVKRVGFLASRLERQGVFVIAALISPYPQSREFVRGLCGTFVEVLVATPLEECERRDTKGLYKKAREGQITQFTGIDDPYEAPERPELQIDTTGLTVDQAAKRVLDHLGRYV